MVVLLTYLKNTPENCPTINRSQILSVLTQFNSGYRISVTVKDLPSLCSSVYPHIQCFLSQRYFSAHATYSMHDKIFHLL